MSRVAVAIPAADLSVLNTSPTTTPLQRTDATAVTAHTAALAEVEAGRASGVVFFGDSITWAWDKPGFGQPSWERSVAPLGAVDFGVNGDQTQNLHWRLLNGELGGQPNVAVVMIGTNNLGYPRLGPQKTAAGVAAVVETIRTVSPGTSVLLLGILPRSSPSDPLRRELAQVNGLIAGLADGTKVRYVNLSSLFLLPDGTIPPELMDTPLLLHPTTAGYQLMSDALRAPIEALLGQPAADGFRPCMTFTSPSSNCPARSRLRPWWWTTAPATDCPPPRLTWLPITWSRPRGPRRAAPTWAAREPRQGDIQPGDQFSHVDSQDYIAETSLANRHRRHAGARSVGPAAERRSRLHRDDQTLESLGSD